MNWALISLLTLVVITVLAFVIKVNIGLLAILAAVILGWVAGFADKEIIAGFSSSMFLMMLGVSFLCAISVANGSLELFAHKFIKLTGGRAWLVPPIIFIIGYLVCAIGPGAVCGLGIVCTLSVPMGKTSGYDSVMLGIIGEMGALAGRHSPLTPTSVVFRTILEPEGIMESQYQNPLIVYSLCTFILLAVITFFMFKGHKVKTNVMETDNLPEFTKAQTMTLLGFVVLVIGSMLFKRNVGLVAFSVGIVLVILKAADEKEVFKAISWSTLLVVTGVGVLMNLVMKSGGVELLSSGLSSVMTPRTAVTIYGLSAGFLSWFSSAIGVVYPTLLPTVKDITETVNVSPIGLLTMIGLCSSFAAFSPASTGGGLIMAAQASEPGFTKQKQNKLFVRLFLHSVLMLLIPCVLSLTGIYGIL
ncbi:SLC13 family permease [Lacrimispora amygdalina]|uniref:SLC13 family permease n=1 Tax=Lacrimispora amygdalina TaxID=253257 RepID=UPI000BE2F02E|nr:SLC13 family permease [Lacrimispora amygdalina]